MKNPNLILQRFNKFIEDASRIHDNFYSYHEFVYTNAHIKGIIICPVHGSFLQNANNHLNGQGCKKCSLIHSFDCIRLTTEEFVKRSVEIHGDTYDYSKTIYGKNNMDKVEIRCRIHDYFYQSPAVHLRGNGCSKCGILKYSLKKKYTKETFIERLDELYPNRTYKIIGKYADSQTKILLETKYGECLNKPNKLIQGESPSISSAINKTSYWINMAKEVHGDKFDYSLVEWIAAKTKVKIICKDHNEFLQTPDNHLQGNGCPSCIHENKNGWTRTLFIEKCKNNQAILYIIKCFSESEIFYKIGITSKTVKKRFHGKSMPYDYLIIEEIEFPPEQIWNLEKELHRKFKEFRYLPKIDFGGKHECFNLTNEQIQEIKNYTAHIDKIKI